MTQKTTTRSLARHLKAITFDTDIEVIDCHASAACTRFKVAGSRECLVSAQLADPAWFPVSGEDLTHGYDGFDGRYVIRRTPENRFQLTRLLCEFGMPESRAEYAKELGVAGSVTRAILAADGRHAARAGRWHRVALARPFRERRKYVPVGSERDILSRTVAKGSSQSNAPPP